jgi:hypothetical protein
MSNATPATSMVVNKCEPNFTCTTIWFKLNGSVNSKFSVSFFSSCELLGLKCSRNKTTWRL